MLATEFRSLQHWLQGALGALWLVVAGPSVEVAAILERVKARTARLTVLMERFDAGTLRTRAFAPRAAVPGAVRAARAAAGPLLWPEHLRGWLTFVATNNPSVWIRDAWVRTIAQRGWNSPHCELLNYAAGLRRMVTEEPAMRAFLTQSGEGRRTTRWLLRMSSGEPVPEILKDTPRPRPPRPETRVRKRRDRWAPPRPPRPPRPARPFAEPPANLSREERERRMLPVPAPRTEEDPMWPPGTIRYNYTSR